MGCEAGVAFLPWLMEASAARLGLCIWTSCRHRAVRSIGPCRRTCGGTSWRSPVPQHPDACFCRHGFWSVPAPSPGALPTLVWGSPAASRREHADLPRFMPLPCRLCRSTKLPPFLMCLHLNLTSYAHFSHYGFFLKFRLYLREDGL